MDDFYDNIHTVICSLKTASIFLHSFKDILSTTCIIMPVTVSIYHHGCSIIHKLLFQISILSRNEKTVEKLLVDGKS